MYYVSEGGKLSAGIPRNIAHLANTMILSATKNDLLRVIIAQVWLACNKYTVEFAMSPLSDGVPVIGYIAMEKAEFEAAKIGSEPTHCITQSEPCVEIRANIQ